MIGLSRSIFVNIVMAVLLGDASLKAGFIQPPRWGLMQKCLFASKQHWIWAHSSWTRNYQAVSHIRTVQPNVASLLCLRRNRYIQHCRAAGEITLSKVAIIESARIMSLGKTLWCRNAWHHRHNLLQPVFHGVEKFQLFSSHYKMQP